jgi:ssDNA-binding replication factor A large subunit
MSDSGSSLEMIIEKICENSKLTKEAVSKLIEEKQEELSGLVSGEGAAYIVAREHGINLLKQSKRQLKVKNLLSGLKSVDLVARIVSITEIREFERNGKAGKVVNLTIGDETGVVRIALWNDDTDLVSGGTLKEDDTVKISNGFVITDNRGNPELRIGKGTIEKVDEKIQVIAVPKNNELQKFTVATRKHIKDVKEGDYVELRASMVQIFKRNMFYDVCPVCNSRLNNSECKDHGPVNPQFNMIVAGVIDDGTENIRAVFFREMAEKMFGMKTDAARELSLKATSPLDVYESFGNLGKEFIFRGRVKRNDLTESTEMIVNEIDDIDVKKEAETLLAKMKY